MKRAVDLAEISDGRLYRSSDLVKLGTGGCVGCSTCCHEVEKTIVLDPYDLWRLECEAGLSFPMLLRQHAELIVTDGLILPVLSFREADPAKGQARGCTFLDEAGRCSIHRARPGICRLYPLGRYYADGDFFYFLQIHECVRARTKVRISRWLETPELPRYEAYIRSWHAFLEQAQGLAGSGSDALQKAVCLRILEIFYQAPWKEETETSGFYPVFAQRLARAEQALGLRKTKMD